MASASKAIRQKRRIRRNLSLTTRAYRQEALDRVKVTSVLLAVLAQAGGEIDVSKETFDTTINALGKIQYVVEKKNPEVTGEPFDGQFVVRLVTTTEPVNKEATAQAFVEAPDGESINTDVVDETTDGNLERELLGGQELEQ